MKKFEIIVKCEDGSIHQIEVKSYNHILNSVVSEVVYDLEYIGLEVENVEVNRIW